MYSRCMFVYVSMCIWSGGSWIGGSLEEQNSVYKWKAKRAALHEIDVKD